MKKKKVSVGFAHSFSQGFFQNVSNTLGGSSGSPVFDSEGSLIGIHQGGEYLDCNSFIDVNNLKKMI